MNAKLAEKRFRAKLAKPETLEELDTFAKYMSSEIMKFEGGDYPSANDNYNLRLFPKYLKLGKEKSLCPARTHKDTRVIEMSKKRLGEVADKNSVYYFVLWCAIAVKCETNREADRISLDYYMTKKTKKSEKRSILRAYSRLIDGSPKSEAIYARYKLIEKRIMQTVKPTKTI